MEESSHCWCVLIASDLLLCHLHLRHDSASYHQIMMNVQSVFIHMIICYLFIKHWMNFVYVAAIETCVNRAGFKNKCFPIQINLNLNDLIHNIPWSNFMHFPVRLKWILAKHQNAGRFSFLRRITLRGYLPMFASKIVTDKKLSASL